MMNDEEYRNNYDDVMAELGKLNVNHPARFAFARLCQEYVEVLIQLNNYSPKSIENDLSTQVS